MKLTLTIAMDNAIFEETPGYEIARILHGLGTQFYHDPEKKDWDFPILDIMGNKVGSVIVSQ